MKNFSEQELLLKANQLLINCKGPDDPPPPPDPPDPPPGGPGRS